MTVDAVRHLERAPGDAQALAGRRGFDRHQLGGGAAIAGNDDFALSLENYQAVQDTTGLCRCRQDREMVERINKLGGLAVARSSVWFAADAVVRFTRSLGQLSAEADVRERQPSQYFQVKAKPWPSTSACYRLLALAAGGLGV